MTITVKNIIPRRVIIDSHTILYTSVNARCVIDKFTLTNTDGVAVNVSIYLPKSGDVVGDAGDANPNCVMYAKSIAAGETYNCPELVGQCIEPGGYIDGKCGAGTRLIASATGREFT